MLPAPYGEGASDEPRPVAHRRHGRGDGVAPTSIEARDAEGRFLRELAHDRPPGRPFVRSRALGLLDGELARLRREYETFGRAGAFRVLKPALTDGSRPVRQAEFTRRLGTTEGPERVAIHRLRRLDRDLVQEAIAATVGDPGEVEDESRRVFRALGDRAEGELRVCL